MHNEDDEVIYILQTYMLVHCGKCNASSVHLITNHCFNKQDISLQIFDLTFTKKWCCTCLLLFFYVKKILAEIKLQFVERKTSEALPFIISALLPSFNPFQTWGGPFRTPPPAKS